MYKNTKYQENRKIWVKVTEKKSEYIGLTEKSSIRAFATRAKNFSHFKSVEMETVKEILVFDLIAFKSERSNDVFALH